MVRKWHTSMNTLNQTTVGNTRMAKISWCHCVFFFMRYNGLLLMWIVDTCLIELFVRNISCNNVRVTWDTVSCYININLGEKDLTLNFF